MKTFSLKETNISKGVACILLLVHHLFGNPRDYGLFYNGLYIGNKLLISGVSASAKVCVAIFVILSGYGLSKSAEKSGKANAYFAYKHLVKLFFQYWFIFVIFVPLGFIFGRDPIDIYGFGIRGIFNFLIDFTGLANIFCTPTMNGTWWYMGVVIILYIMFPIFFKMIKKSPYVSLAAAFAVCIFGTAAGRWYHALLAWIFPFVAGIYLAQSGLLDKTVNLKHKGYVATISLVSAILITVARYAVSGFVLRIDTFFALAIIIFTVSFLSYIKYAGSLLEFIGIHSANIFMMHTFIYLYYFQRAIYAVYYPVFIVCVLLAITLLISVGLEKLKALLRYDELSKALLRAGGSK